MSVVAISRDSLLLLYLTGRNPFLDAVDDVVLAIGRLGGGRLKVGNIGAGIGLSDSQGHALSAGKDFRHNLLLERLGTKVEDGGQRDGHTTNDTVIGTADTPAGHFLVDNHLSQQDQTRRPSTFDRSVSYLVEVVILLGSDATGQLNVEFLQEFARANVGGQETAGTELLHEFVGGAFTSDVVAAGLLSQVVHDLADGGAEAEVGLLEVGRLEAHPGARLGVGHLGKRTASAEFDFGLLALDGADLIPLVLGQYFLTVKTVEGVGRVLARVLQNRESAARVHVNEPTHVVDLGVNNDPHVTLCIVALNLLSGERL